MIVPTNKVTAPAKRLPGWDLHQVGTMKKLYIALASAIAYSVSLHAGAAASASGVSKAESCTAEEAKAQAGMNTIFGGIKSRSYVDSNGKQIQSKPPRKCPPSKAEQDAGMRTMYGNIRSSKYVKGPATK